MKVIFMGTPDFAVPTLISLAKNHQVVAVYTQRPKPAGRGLEISLSAINLAANELALEVFTPKSLRSEDVINQFNQIEADIVVVVAYGLILPKEILNKCKYGAINVHPSLLPDFRGAAPMQRTILAGQKETAMCIIKMDEGIDTGDILIQEVSTLDDNITYLELSEKMANLGAELTLKALENIDHIKPKKQSKEGSYAQKIIKEEGEISWRDSSEVISRKIRALNPWPGTYFIYNNEKIKILKANVHLLDHQFIPGSMPENYPMMIACVDGLIEPLILQRPGKKQSIAAEFYRGFKWNKQ